MAYNAATLLADVAFKLQNNPRYTPAVQLDGLNRAIVKLYEYSLENVDVYETEVPVDPQDPSKFANEIPLPPRTYFVDQVTFHRRPLARMTTEQWVNTRTNENLDKGTWPIYYYVRNNQYLEIYPRPTEQHRIDVFGLFAPPDLVLPTDVPALDPRYTDAAVAYAAWWCLDSQTGEGERASAMMQNYLAFRAEAKFNATQSSIHTLSRAR